MTYLAVFDIDGTLHQTHEMSMQAYQIVMPKLGLPVPSLKALFNTFGCTANEITRILQIPENLHAQFWKLMDTEEVRQIPLCAKCYEGVIDALFRLHKANIAVALCSMCSPAYMEAFVDAFGLSSIVQLRRNESDGTEKAALLSEILKASRATKAVMVGDRVFDFAAARENGIKSIGCLYGYAPEEAALADEQIYRSTDLYDAVCRVLLD